MSRVRDSSNCRNTWPTRRVACSAAILLPHGRDCSRSQLNSNGSSVCLRVSGCAAKRVLIWPPSEIPSAERQARLAEMSRLQVRAKERVEGKARAMAAKAAVVWVRARVVEKVRAKVKGKDKGKAREIKLDSLAAEEDKGASRPARADRSRCAEIQHRSKQNSTRNRCRSSPLEDHVPKPSRKPASVNVPSWTTAM